MTPEQLREIKDTLQLAIKNEFIPDFEVLAIGYLTQLIAEVERLDAKINCEADFNGELMVKISDLQSENQRLREALIPIVEHSKCHLENDDTFRFVHKKFIQKAKDILYPKPEKL